jgi:hypothetical protein
MEQRKRRLQEPPRCVPSQQRCSCEPLPTAKGRRPGSAARAYRDDYAGVKVHLEAQLLLLGQRPILLDILELHVRVQRAVVAAQQKRELWSAFQAKLAFQPDLTCLCHPIDANVLQSTTIDIVHPNTSHVT